MVGKMGRSGNAVPGHFTMVAGSGMLVVHTDTGLRPTTKVQTVLCCWVHGRILSASSLMCIAGNRRVRKRGRHLRISMENHGPVAILSRLLTCSVYLKIHLDGFSPCSQQKSRHDQQRQQVHQATISVHVVSSIASSRGEMQMRGRTNKISMDFAPAPPPPQFRPRSTATVLRHCSIIGGFLCWPGAG